MQDKDIFGQFGKPEKLTLSWSTFWKIVLAMALSCLILLGLYLGFRYLTQSQSDPVRQEGDLRKQAARVLRQLEDALFAEWDAAAKSLDQIIPHGSEINESVLRKWMDEKTNLLSVGIQVKDSFPVQFVPDRFWESELVRKLPESERQKLLQFIFPDQERLSSGMTLLHVSSVVNPLVRIIWKSSINERKYVFIQVLTPLDPLFSQILPSKIQFALADTDEITLSENRDIVPREESEEWIRSEIRSARLGWKLILEEPVKSGLASGILSNPFFLPVLLFILFILFAVIAYTITRWIDSPMGPLYETAMRISRGDFSLRLPGSSSKKGNRLARLINYMVEEMDHLQKINVSKIIVEKRKTETILKNIADAVIVTDNADRILVLNAVAEKWFDCLESVAVRQGLSQILKESTLIQMIRNVREKGQPDSAEFQVRILGYAQPRTLHAHGAPVKSQDGRKIGVVTVIRDVSEEREVERLKTELVSMVAHELKSPLTSIHGFSELLLKSELKTEKSKEYSRIILNESSRLTDLINKFLDLSKLESGATEPRLVSFDIQESIQRMLDAHGPQASRKKIHVIFDVARSIPNVLGDPDLLDQVLLNLFSNAVKYSPSGSKVGIEVKSEGRFVTVQMIDNGHGISKQDLPKIFNKFFRAAESGDENAQNGSGLGLALVKEIIEKLGGKVHVKSQRGVGSIFSFSLPQAVS